MTARAYRSLVGILTVVLTVLMGLFWMGAATLGWTPTLHPGQAAGWSVFAPLIIGFLALFPAIGKVDEPVSRWNVSWYLLCVLAAQTLGLLSATLLGMLILLTPALFESKTWGVLFAPMALFKSLFGASIGGVPTAPCDELSRIDDSPRPRWWTRAQAPPRRIQRQRPRKGSITY